LLFASNIPPIIKAESRKQKWGKGIRENEK